MLNDIITEDRGDCGVILEHSFLNCFIARLQDDPTGLDAYFAEVAYWGPLTFEQMVVLLQHLPPPPKGWSMYSTWTPDSPCLAEHAAVVDRFLADVERGAFPKAATADELAAWCDKVGASLPEPLVAALRDKADAAAGNTSVKQSTIDIEIPTWAPLAKPAAQEETSKRRQRGRPQKMPEGGLQLINAAERVLLDAASQGKHLTLDEVARAVKRMPIASGMTEDNIVRRLKGKLPIKTARQVAAANAAGLKQRAHPFKM